jgi:hypothetical protein
MMVERVSGEPGAGGIKDVMNRRLLYVAVVSAFGGILFA